LKIRKIQYGPGLSSAASLPGFLPLREAVSP
jgi:hypothetical protein